MQRILILVFVISVCAADSAFAATYAQVKGNVTFGNSSTDADLTIDTSYNTGSFVNGVNSIIGDWSYLVGAEGRFHEVFCIDPETVQSNVVYDLKDLDEADVVNSFEAGIIKKLVQTAIVAGDLANGFVGTTGEVSGAGKLTDFQFTSLAGAQGNEDVTVVGLQKAIWATLGMTSHSYDNPNSMSQWLLANYSTYGGVLGANVLALVDSDPGGSQDFALVLGGEGQSEGVPEPGSMVALCGLGLMFGGAAYRRRRRNS